MSEAPQAHVLVVDDDARIRELLRKFLARNGFWVSGAAAALALLVTALGQRALGGEREAGDAAMSPA